VEAARVLPSSVFFEEFLSVAKVVVIHYVEEVAINPRKI
jgi:hypothetical protein